LPSQLKSPVPTILHFASVMVPMEALTAWYELSSSQTDTWPVAMLRHRISALPSVSKSGWWVQTEQDPMISKSSMYQPSCWLLAASTESKVKRNRILFRRKG